MHVNRGVSASGLIVLAVCVFLIGLPAAEAQRAGADHQLIEAIKAQDLVWARELLDDGADVDETQPDGATALHWAAHREDLAAVELLLEAGANVAVANELGATPLWVASVNGTAPVIERLLRAGANPSIRLPEGETPLLTASRSGNVDAVKLLLAGGASPNAREERRHQTALMWAAARGHTDIVRVLIDAGADVGARSKARERLLFADKRQGNQYDQGVEVAKGGYTPLLFCARRGQLEAARLLLAAGADVNDQAPDGASALVVAAHSGHIGLVEQLLESGAEPNAIDAGYAPLHAAVLRGEIAMVRALLAHGADPNLRLEKGTALRRAGMDWALRPAFVSATPYWLAAQYREPEIMQVLADGGADPSIRTLPRPVPVKARAGGVGPPRMEGGFETPLLAAVRGQNDRERRFLLDGRFVDRAAEERLALQAVSIAIDHGADIDALDRGGNTVLHGAASNNFIPLIRLLAERGAQLEMKNKGGRTPLDVAKAAEERRGRRSDTVESGPSAADVLRELGATR